MLTGDKGKTAKMIGVQCGMFSSLIKEHDEFKQEQQNNNEIIEETPEKKNS